MLLVVNRVATLALVDVDVDILGYILNLVVLNRVRTVHSHIHTSMVIEVRDVLALVLLVAAVERLLRVHVVWSRSKVLVHHNAGRLGAAIGPILFQAELLFKLGLQGGLADILGLYTRGVLVAVARVILGILAELVLDPGGACCLPILDVEFHNFQIALGLLRLCFSGVLIGGLWNALNHEGVLHDRGGLPLLLGGREDLLDLARLLLLPPEVL